MARFSIVLALAASLATAWPTKANAQAFSDANILWAVVGLLFEVVRDPPRMPSASLAPQPDPITLSIDQHIPLLRPGMRPAEVLAVMGEPDNRYPDFGRDNWRYGKYAVCLLYGTLETVNTSGRC